MQESHATIVVKETDVYPDATVRRVPPGAGASGAAGVTRIYTVGGRGVVGFFIRLALGLIVLAIAIPLVAVGLACFVVAVPVILVLRMLRKKS